MKQVMKRRYSFGALMRPAMKSGMGMEAAATRGLVMLFSDLSSKSVGFEGLGFFTLTYSLIGSVSIVRPCLETFHNFLGQLPKIVDCSTVVLSPFQVLSLILTYSIVAMQMT